jgi:molecular chaperone IbpA
MRYDFSPLFRHTVGFDRLFNMLDDVSQQQAPSYPPYNIEKVNDDSYRITLAVAGFSEKDLEIESRDNQLIVSGQIEKAENQDAEETDGPTVVYRGIAERAFERRFSLAEHVRVENAVLENGLLHIELVREVPEALKPRQIPIGSAANKRKAIGSKAA